jgi:predicted GNAT family N-acyltransferase
MPTLRPITSHAEILAYHRFRYEVYANSAQRGFLAGPEGIDTDAYDANALHLGWYEGEELVGCVRLLSPIKGTHPLHFTKDLLDLGQLASAVALLADAKAAGKPLCEVSRLCLAPEYRSLATIRRFVLEIISTAHRYGRDHCLFTCDDHHVAFWKRMGFATVIGFEGYARPRSENAGYLLQGNYRALLALHRAELQRMGFRQVAQLNLAA